MDKKYIERPAKNDKFNRSAYNAKYAKEHYKRYIADISPELMEDLTEFCSRKNISRAEFLKLALTTLKGLEK